MKYFLTIGFLLASVLSIGAKGCEEQGEIWVADRGSSSVSIIDAGSNQVVETVTLPDDAEPMYVSSDDDMGRVFVGDRANDQVFVLDSDTRELIDRIKIGAGVFHMWHSAKHKTLWVNADVDKKTVVVDGKSLDTLAEIKMPVDLAEMGGKPHDVFIDPKTGAGFVSYVGFEGEHDYVVRFDPKAYEETARAAVGKDPHLFANQKHKGLFVPCQGTNQVLVLNRRTLETVADVDVPGAHGVYLSPNGNYLYTTNLPQEGVEAIFTTDTKSYTLVSDQGQDAAMDGKPHNIALTDSGKMMYVTHSGPEASTVSIFELVDGPEPTFVDSIQVGTNPFGLAYVK